MDAPSSTDGNESCHDHKLYREGALLESAAGDIASAIARVGTRLLERSGDEHVRDVVADCVATLPAQAL